MFAKPHLPLNRCAGLKPAQQMTVLAAHRQRNDFNLLVCKAIEHPASHLAPLNFTQACRLDVAPGEMSPQAFAEMFRRRIAVVARYMLAMFLRAPTPTVTGQPITISRDDDMIPIVPPGSHIPFLQRTNETVQR